MEVSMPGILARLLPALLLGICLAAPASADSGKSILVLDASGSMWGQIEGEAKITIARGALFGLLDSLPAEQELGLVAYGHRRKGDCGDIELMVPAGPGTREQIRAAVAAISPKGKTPLSQAVIDAAEALRYEEARATVILLSDGIETCDLDPCAVGRALEEAGVDFTAHVIGFDVAAEKDQAQLRCLAENTGGRFLTASNAAELAEALQQVSVEQPAPAEVAVLFRATEGEGGPVIDEPLLWSLATADGNALVSDESAATLERSLPPGRYRVEAQRPGDAATVSEEFQLEAGGSQLVVTLVFDSPLPSATLQAPHQAPAGSAVTVGYLAPKAYDDEIQVAEVGAKDSAWLRYELVREEDRVEILLPTLAGPYELRYVDSRGRVLARQLIEATPIEGSVTAPPVGPAGGTIEVGWSGPAYPGDYIAVVEVGADVDAYLRYALLDTGNPVELGLPTELGVYEIRYQLGQDRRVLASATIEVVGIDATLNAPPEAPAGSTVAVAWTGPAYRGDYISVSPADAEPGAYVNYVTLDAGSPAELVLPTAAGTYEIRYVLNQDRSVLASTSIVALEVGASLALPATAPAGGAIEVAWTGPGYDRDYISISRLDEEDGAYLEYADVGDESPVTLQLPAEPGAYEVRYVLSQDRSVLARAPITLTEVTASLLASAAAPAGSRLQVGWSGPGYRGDYVSISEVGSKPGAYIHYADVRAGEPSVELQLPSLPGSYEIRYILGQERKQLASHRIQVTEVTATLQVPASGKAGTAIVVTWSGPDYRGDYISVAKPDGKGHSYIEYRNTSEGSPLSLPLPKQPGTYEIRYVMREGNRVLATAPVTVE